MLLALRHRPLLFVQSLSRELVHKRPGTPAAVKTGRLIFQRILSYILRSITKKIAQMLLLAIGLMMTGQAVLTPLLMVIVMITGDFLSMAYATDRVKPSETPNSWSIGKITLAGVIFGLGFCHSAQLFSP
jgi:H+-transporting ATPase